MKGLIERERETERERKKERESEKVRKTERACGKIHSIVLLITHIEMV